MSSINHNIRFAFKHLFKVIGILCLLITLKGNTQQSARLIDNWEFLKQDLGGVWEAVRPIKKDNPESYPLWTKVQLPHCVNAEDAVDPDVNYYQGPAWYRTQLSIINPYKKGRTLIHFEGAGQKTEVYVYNKKVGEHIGGYDEWSVDITNAIDSFSQLEVYKKQFQNRIPISIRTDNSRDLEMIPSDLSDFNIYGGLYRYVNLVYTPALSIDKVFITPLVSKEGKRGTMHIKTRLYNPLQVDEGVLSFKLRDPKGKLIQQGNKKLKSFDGTINLADLSIQSPYLWSPEVPNLYTVEVAVQSGTALFTQTEKVGFRHFEFVTKGPFMLNGKRLLLKGTQRHEDHAGVAAALTEDIMRQEFLLMKEMGVNFIRLGHFQNSRIALDLCDSLGIMAWEEIPWCRGGLGGDRYKSQARSMLTNMIEQHFNHPAVIIWGLGNENDWPGDFTTFDTVAIRTFMKELNTMAHQLDPNRKTGIRRCDFCKDIVDVYSPSIWAGWYRGIYTEYKEFSVKEFNRVDHFFHMEWGGDSHARRFSEKQDSLLVPIKRTGNSIALGEALPFAEAAKQAKDNDWSESYICNLFDWHLKEQETMPWLTGTAQWIFKDFSTPIRPENPVPYVNQKGVVERDFTKKEAYYVFQSYWSQKPMVHIYGHSQPIRWGKEGETKMIKVYSNCDEAELFINNISYGVKRRDSQNFPAAGLRWNLPLFNGNYEVRVRAKKGAVTIEDTTRFSYQTANWGQTAKAVLEKIKEENGMISLEVKVFDEKGIPCLNASDWVRFDLVGEGELIVNQGTSTGSRLVQLYNGRAIIRMKKNNGKSVVSAKVGQLPSAFIQL